ncbi:hypothetical protein C0J52_01815 [Blattella germanica]|nr:hypothetical protein C0J52_01815 [Blattella germanica]
MRPDIAPTLFHMHQNELQHKHTHLENLVSFQSRSLERPVEAVPMQTIPIPSPIIANNAHSVQLADPAAVPMVSTVIVPRDDAAAEEAFNVGHGVQFPPAANMQILRDDLMKNGRITADVKKIKTSDVKSEEGNDLPNRESSSTVILRRPEMNADGGLSLGPRVMERLMGACATVWKGYVNIPDVAKFFTTVQVVSGDSQNLCRDLPESVDIVGSTYQDCWRIIYNTGNIVTSIDIFPVWNLELL